LDGRKDRGKTVYPPPPSGSGGIIIFSFERFIFINEIDELQEQNTLKWFAENFFRI
jgi:hypothetical protein